ncbi:MAG TPA: hypothetical protein PKZ83_17415 [bacterium]|nr:hypothetical protein [bacterium]HQJ66273.1 hypothetical protein [bacterium]
MFLAEKRKNELVRLDTRLLEIGLELLRNADNEKQRLEIHQMIEEIQKPKTRTLKNER